MRLVQMIAFFFLSAVNTAEAQAPDSLFRSVEGLRIRCETVALTERDRFRGTAVRVRYTVGDEREAHREVEVWADSVRSPLRVSVIDAQPESSGQGITRSAAVVFDGRGGGSGMLMHFPLERPTSVPPGDPPAASPVDSLQVRAALELARTLAAAGCPSGGT